jgi:hypothetical protein
MAFVVKELAANPLHRSFFNAIGVGLETNEILRLL